jgi:hypothetical protein
VGLVVCRWGFVWLLALLAAGSLLHYIEVASLLGIGSLLLLAWWLEEPQAVAWACLAMGVLTAVTRSEAEGSPLPPASWVRRRVLVRRLPLDRDRRARDARGQRGFVEGHQTPRLF